VEAGSARSLVTAKLSGGRVSGFNSFSLTQFEDDKKRIVTALRGLRQVHILVIWESPLAAATICHCSASQRQRPTSAFNLHYACAAPRR
jgi:hypothetical protein